MSLRGMTPLLINLISGLYSGTKSAVKCGDTISDYLPRDTGVRQRCIFVYIPDGPQCHLGCQHPSAEVAQMLSEDMECQNAIYGRVLGCETRLLMSMSA